MKLKVLYTILTVLIIFSCSNDESIRQIIESEADLFSKQVQNHNLFVEISDQLKTIISDQKLDIKNKQGEKTFSVKNKKAIVEFNNKKLVSIEHPNKKINIKNANEIEIIYQKDKKQKKGIYKNGVYQGVFIRNTDSTSIEVQFSKSGDTTSLTEVFKNDKKRRTLNFFNNKRNGNYTVFYSKGTMKLQNTYDNGLIEGEKREWYKNGKLKSKCNFNKGKKEGLEIVNYENAQSMKLKTEYLNGKENGLRETWYPSAKRKSKISFRFGKLNGKCMIFHEGNKMKLRGNYKDDLRDGDFTVWDSKGKVVYSAVYKDGEIIKLKSIKKENESFLDLIESDFF